MYVWAGAVSLLTVLCSLGASYARPSLCCSPDQWETKILNVGVSVRQGYDFNNMDVRMAYDYKNDRWAIDQVHPTNSTHSLKLVFNHFENKRYAINNEGCFVQKLEAPMNKYCIPDNSTFVGKHTAGVGNNKLTYVTWCYDFFFYPLRQNIAVTPVSKGVCLPVKEVSYGLVQNTWSWEEGDPACIPWEDPEVVVLGECYKSYRKNVREYSSTTPTAPMVNMDFSALNLTISNEALFDVPENCVESEDWDEIRLNDFWRLLIMRMKFFDFEAEVGIF